MGLACAKTRRRPDPSQLHPSGASLGPSLFFLLFGWSAEALHGLGHTSLIRPVFTLLCFERL